MCACPGATASPQPGLVELRPTVAVLILTTYDDEGTAFAALRAGARGVLTKAATAQEIRAAIVAVYGGERAGAAATRRASAEPVPAPGG